MDSLILHYNGFCNSSVISIPIITFIIGYTLSNLNIILLTIGLIASIIFNIILKCIFSLFYNPIFYRPHQFILTNNNHFSIIGFPSGHSQVIWFFSFFLFLLSKNKKQWMTYLLFILPIIISLSRIGWTPFKPFKISTTIYHTPLQIIIGSFIGIITAYYFYKNHNYLSNIIKKSYHIKYYKKSY